MSNIKIFKEIGSSDVVIELTTEEILSQVKNLTHRFLIKNGLFHSLYYENGRVFCFAKTKIKFDLFPKDHTISDYEISDNNWLYVYFADYSIAKIDIYVEKHKRNDPDNPEIYPKNDLKAQFSDETIKEIETIIEDSNSLILANYWER